MRRVGTAGLLPPWECAQAGGAACYLNAFAVHAVSERQFTVQRGNG